jgi:S-adenosylmethionine:tRNA ribosyltransferase-isomerase
MTAATQRAPALLDAVAPPERRGIQRDAVRMLVTDRMSRAHTHVHFFDLPSVLRADDLLVVNDSSTLPAALPATRANGERIALHVSTMIDARVWMAEPRATVRVGEELALPGHGSALVIAPVEPERPRLWYARFALPLAMNAYLARFGEPIRYGYVTQRFPLSDYQTLFAREPGSSEMPSAARPFTPRVAAALRQRGIGISTVTLHSGVASFEAPETPASERFAVPHATAQAVNAARHQGRRVIAVGSTVLRALESAVRDGGDVVAACGWTDLVINERHAVKTVNGLLTGFHDASATHLWVLGSFLDPDLLGSAYDTAANHAYYRHEFGDVHLIL